MDVRAIILAFAASCFAALASVAQRRTTRLISYLVKRQRTA
jgi:hypothetical protein